MEYYSALKKNEIMPFAAMWRDLEILILSEVRKTKTNIISITYRWNLTKQYKKPYLQNRNRLTDIGNKLWLPKRKGGVGINEEFGISRYKLLYIK